MKEIKKVLGEEVVTTIEKYSYEFEARKSVITEMISQDMDINTPAFEKYQKELVKYKVLYETAKKEIENTYVADIEGWTNWTLDYGTRVLTIKIDGESDD